jgi:PAT family beta-lactamase induction signal transducer AmpG
VVMGLGLVIATASASQDITIDALRIEQVSDTEKSAMAAGAAIAVVGWWSGYKIGGMLMLFVADWLEKAGHINYWQLTFLMLCGLICLANIGLLLIPEASASSRIAAQQKAAAGLAARFGSSQMAIVGGFLAKTVWGPLGSFFRKNGISVALALLGFIFLFKVGEAFMGKMSLIFYKEIGFSKSDIALYSKGLGWITTVAFTILGGFLAIRSGTFKALLFAGIAMAATNIMFSILAWTGKSEWVFALAVLLDDIAAAFATVAFVTFISLLVDRTYTATQYALLASIGTMGRTTLASSSGALVDWLHGDWGVFFIITALMVIPSLILLLFIRTRIPN